MRVQNLCFIKYTNYIFRYNLCDNNIHAVFVIVIRMGGV